MNSVSHFEIPAEDMGRAESFYSNVFGWEMGEDMGGTRLVSTTEVDNGGMSSTPGAINGDIFKRDELLNKPLVVITVPNIDEHLEKIKNANGEIVVAKTAVGDMGWCAYFKDTEGNVLGIWENPTA